MKKSQAKVILGIDPGTNVMGFGVIQVNGSTLKPLQFGVIRLTKFSSHALKLKKVYDQVTELIEHYQPHEVALEAPFFGKNVQSMLKLGRVQGVAMAAAMAFDLPVEEYAPMKVKKAVTGKGQASKEQVSAMVMRLLNLKEQPELFDATDALGVAICHHLQEKALVKSTSSWSTFVNNNPDRIK